MYTRTQKSELYIVNNNAGKALYFFSHDRESSGDRGRDILADYIDHAKEMFQKECNVLLDTTRPFTERDEAKLRSMLTLLIESRRTLQEEENFSKEKVLSTNPISSAD